MAKPFTVDQMWPGLTAVIIGGGPSLSLAQIRTIAQARTTQKCRVIAVNDAVYPAWWADWLHASDTKWWHWNIQSVQHFRGIKTTVCDDCPDRWVDGYLRYTGREGFDPDPSCIRTGGNSVYQAMHIAIHAGVKRIVLVGVDMKRGADGESHWFGEHHDRIVPDYAETLIPAFATLVPEIEARGVRVTNASPGSALLTFPFAPIEEAFA